MAKLVALIAIYFTVVSFGAILNDDKLEIIYPVPVDTPPKTRDYSETIKVGKAAGPVSKVDISVGETGFIYKVSGTTYSTRRIAVSGTYFNDPATRSGSVRLFLVVDTGVAYYALRPNGNQLEVYVRNYYYDEFLYTIFCPYPVRALNMFERQFNSTTVLITGPSRSQVY